MRHDCKFKMKLNWVRLVLLLQAALCCDIECVNERLKVLEEENQEFRQKIEALELGLKDASMNLVYERERREEKTATLEITTKSAMDYPASCQQLSDKGKSESGKFMIQPSPDVEPFIVDCVFENSTGTTKIQHSHSQKLGYTSRPDSSNGCYEKGCFVDEITYEASINQIEALVEISTDCYQTIRHNCSVNALTDFSWWTGRDNRDHYYWHGDFDGNETGCACKFDNSCQRSKYSRSKCNECNCDSRSKDMIDEGVLTSLAQLPVQKLHYGDSKERFQWIQYTLGQFQCSGKKQHYPNEEKVWNKIDDLEASDIELETTIDQLETQLASHSSDILKKSADISKNSADISKHSVDISKNFADISRNHGSIASTNSKVSSNTARINDIDPKSFPAFFVYYDGMADIAPTVKFNRIEYNTGSMYSSSTGKVTIPITGLYQFSVNLRKNPDSNRVSFSILVDGSAYTDIIT
jgi:hypothetical protein